MAIARPAPRETGKTKGARSSGRDEAWKRAERKVSVRYQEIDGPTEDPTLKKLQTSTGRIGHLTELRMDSVSRNYAIEVKHRILPKWLLDYWILCLQNGFDYKLHPILALTIVRDQQEFQHEGKKYRLSDMHIVTAERHAQLLESERRDQAHTQRLEDLVAALEALAQPGDPESNHSRADVALVAALDDDRVAARFGAIEKWYA